MEEKENKIISRNGLFAKIVFKSGNIIYGVIKEWTNDYALLTTKDGEVVEILNPTKDIETITYIYKLDGTLLSERSEEDVEPQHSPGDIDSAAAVAKWKGDSDRQNFREKLTSLTCAAGEVEHESQLSIVSSIKNYTKRKDKG